MVVVAEFMSTDQVAGDNGNLILDVWDKPELLNVNDAHLSNAGRDAP